MKAKCVHCDGSGVKPEFLHISNGICFHCEGKGEVECDTSSNEIYKTTVFDFNDGHSLIIAFNQAETIVPYVRKYSCDADDYVAFNITVESAREMYRAYRAKHGRQIDITTTLA